MAVIELAGAIADPDHMARGSRYQSPVVEIDPREGLLVTKKQRFVAGIEIRGAQLGDGFRDRARRPPHEVEARPRCDRPIPCKRRDCGEIFQETQQSIDARSPELANPPGRETRANRLSVAADCRYAINWRCGSGMRACGVERDVR